MAAEFEWTSPGGVYQVPEEFRVEFAKAFPGYRIRWSVARKCWQIEQPCGKPAALPPIQIDNPFADDLIRARDGYWLVMENEPGRTMACKAYFQHNHGKRETCGWPIPVPLHKTSEVICPVCKRAGRRGRTFAGHWRWDATLLSHLHRTDPLRDGTRAQTRASDATNAAIVAEAERRQSDSVTSLDAVDYRWISGIGSSSGRTRRTIDERDLL